MDFEDGNTFLSCPIDSIYLGRNIIFSGDSPFKGNRERLSKIVLGNLVTKIADNEFIGHTGLTSLTLPPNIEVIGEKAFYGCSNIPAISIPCSVNEIRSNAFNMCTSVKTFTIEDGTKELTFTSDNYMGNSPIESIYLGRNIVCMNNDSPFNMIPTLTSLIIGKNVTKIGDGTFALNNKLKDVISYSESIPATGQNIFTESYLTDATLKVPYALYNDYKTKEPWNLFGTIQNFEGLYNLTYLIDNHVHKEFVIEQGTEITPEESPSIEGYTFSGWSEIPETMPAHDVTVAGSFNVNSYKLIYMVDGVEYKMYEINYGSNITAEIEPTKVGYTFNGWSEIPETMPAHDVTVTGSFNINSYTLIYMVDDEVYKTYEVEYGADITPENTPRKTGYTFSGWSEIPSVMPAKNITISGTFTINSYKLVYVVDGIEYKTIEVEYDAAIIPEAELTKEGHTFSGWSEIPETMPANDVTVTGSFTVNSYTLTYMTDGELYKTFQVDYGTAITPEAYPTKTGYTFSGWVDIPTTMPARDVTVRGTFTINSYVLKYLVDGKEYKSYEVEYGTSIMAENELTKEGYTFSGWSDIPETMPANDVTVTGSFIVNKYQVTYIIDGEVFATDYVEYGATIVPPTVEDKEGYTFDGWADVPETMPAYDLTIYGSFTSGIAEIVMETKSNVRIYSPNGKKIDKLQKGLNVVVLEDGNVKKIIVR